MRLSQGSSGPEVQKLQVYLVSKGYGPLALDGLFGRNTLGAVLSYQRSTQVEGYKGQALNVDGIVGDQTWAALVGDSGVTPPMPTTPPPDNAAVAIKRVRAGASVLRGFDVSSYQPQVDFVAAKKEGMTFCFIKAAEYSQDPSFKTHWAAAKAAGMIRGAYDYFHPNLSAELQAEALVAILEAAGGEPGAPLGAGDLGCVIDWETTDDVLNPKDLAAGLAFLQAVEAATHKVPIIYGSPYFLQTLFQSQGSGRPFARYPLWIADYGSAIDVGPRIPTVWDNWTFWQYSDAAAIDGISGGNDANLFNGDMIDLRAFAGLT